MHFQETVKFITRLEINYIIDKSYLDIKTQYTSINGVKYYIICTYIQKNINKIFLLFYF